MADPRKGRKLAPRQELLLALSPTLTVLLVLWLFEALSTQRLLFSSLASSAFLIYLVPEHPINNARTLMLAQLIAAVAGVTMLLLVGPGYASAGAAMVLAIAAIERQPAPDALVVDYTAAGVKLRVRWWITPPRRSDALDTQDRVLEQLKQVLSEQRAPARPALSDSPAR